MAPCSKLQYTQSVYRHKASRRDTIHHSERISCARRAATRFEHACCRLSGESPAKGKNRCASATTILPSSASLAFSPQTSVRWTTSCQIDPSCELFHVRHSPTHRSLKRQYVYVRRHAQAAYTHTVRNRVGEFYRFEPISLSLLVAQFSFFCTRYILLRGKIAISPTAWPAPQ